MYCEYCGRKIEDDAKSCTYCGKTVRQLKNPSIIIEEYKISQPDKEPQQTTLINDEHSSLNSHKEIFEQTPAPHIKARQTNSKRRKATGMSIFLMLLMVSGLGFAGWKIIPTWLENKAIVSVKEYSEHNDIQHNPLSEDQETSNISFGDNSSEEINISEGDQLLDIQENAEHKQEDNAIPVVNEPKEGETAWDGDFEYKYSSERHGYDLVRYHGPFYQDGRGKSITIPSEFNGYPVVGLLAYALADCDIVTIPNSITYISSYCATYGNVSKIILEPGNQHFITEGPFLLTKDRKEVLAVCGGRKSELFVPEGVETFYTGAILEQSPIKLVLPSTLKKCDGPIFWIGFFEIDCSAIEISESNPYFTTKDGVLYSKDMTVLVKCPGKYEKSEFYVPESVKAIKNNAFTSCQNIAKVYIENGTEGVEQSGLKQDQIIYTE